MFFALAGSVGEPVSAKIAAIDRTARMYPPKRSPWYGTADAALKVTLWNGNGTGLPQKMKVDANLGGGQARDFYWFEAGKVTYGTQARRAGGESIERRLTFASGKLAAVEERRAASDQALGRAAFHGVAPEEVAKLRASVASLLQECLKAPGLRDRKATVKSVEADRVVLQTAPGVEAWISRRSGDAVASSLIGRPVTYDFTAVDEDGREMDYLNALEPLSKAPPKAMLASAAPVGATPAVAAPALAKPTAAPVKTTEKTMVKTTMNTTAKTTAKKPAARKGAKKKARARKAATVQSASSATAAK